MRNELKARVIIFDFDGTIVYLETEWEHLRAKLHHFCLGKFDLNNPFKPLDAGLKTIKHLNENAFKEAIDIVAAYEIGGYKGKVNNNVLDFIKKEMSPSQKLAVFSSNTRRAIKTILTRLTIYPDAIVGKEDILDNPKPSESGLLRILKHFNVKSDEALFIGNSQMDLEAGCRSGVKTFLWSKLWT